MLFLFCYTAVWIQMCKHNFSFSPARRNSLDMQLPISHWVNLWQQPSNIGLLPLATPLIHYLVSGLSSKCPFTLLQQPPQMVISKHCLHHNSGRQLCKWYFTNSKPVWPLLLRNYSVWCFHTLWTLYCSRVWTSCYLALFPLSPCMQGSGFAEPNWCLWYRP